jgi:hypothetical protein
MRMEIKTPDIFGRTPDDKTDKWYRVVRERKDFQKVKKHLHNLWEFFYKQKLNDPHFLAEFPVRLFHRWWEMEVGWFLHYNGYMIRSEACGPDFICSKADSEIYVEAVLCEPGDANSINYSGKLISNPYKDGEIKIADVNLPERERLELLRIRNSIENKVRQYQQHKDQGLIDPKKPYIIALSSVMIPDMVSNSDGVPSAVKAVYPVGQIYLSFTRNSTKAISGGRTYRPKIKKNDTSDVNTDIFLPSSLSQFYEGVSGILYSNSSFIGDLYLSAMRNSFIFIHNFVSLNPVQQSIFGANMDYWIEKENDDYLLKNNRIDN